MTMAVLEQSKTTTPVTLNQAYRYALDPTSEQVSLLRSHIGGTRFTYNALLGLVKENWDENRVRREAGLEVAQEDYLGTARPPTTPPPSDCRRPSRTGVRAEPSSPPSKSAEVRVR